MTASSCRQGRQRTPQGRPSAKHPVHAPAPRDRPAQPQAQSQAQAWTAAPSGAALAISRGLARDVPALATDRLRLRAPRIEDHPIYAGFVAPYIDSHDGWLDFCEMTAGWLLRGHGPWTVERDGTAIGCVLIGHEYGDPERELGWLLLPEHQGHGYATEAAAASRDWAWTTLGLPTLVGYVDPDNAASGRVAHRLGATRDPVAEAAAKAAAGGADPVQVWRHRRPA